MQNAEVGLAHWPLMLEVPGSITKASGKENLVSKHASLRVISRDDMTQ